MVYCIGENFFPLNTLICNAKVAGPCKFFVHGVEIFSYLCITIVVELVKFIPIASVGEVQPQVVQPSNCGRLSPLREIFFNLSYYSKGDELLLQGKLVYYSQHTHTYLLSYKPTQLLEALEQGYFCMWYQLTQALLLNQLSLNFFLFHGYHNLICLARNFMYIYNPLLCAPLNLIFYLI